MRTTLFLSTLFAVTLVGGVALADRPIDRLEHRTHGDQIDKMHAQDARPSLSNMDRASRVTSLKSENTGAKQRFMPGGESRVNCSADGADCAASHGNVAHSKSSMSTGSLKQGKTMIQNKYGNGQKGGDGGGGDSETCSEADQCSVSSKAAKAIWAGSGSSTARQGLTPMAAPGSVSRALQQKIIVAGSPEDVQDTPSSDASKKIWAQQAVKAGTFKGPLDLDVSSQMHRAAARIAEMKGTRLTPADKSNDKATHPTDKGEKEADER